MNLKLILTTLFLYFFISLSFAQNYNKAIDSWEKGKKYGRDGNYQKALKHIEEALEYFPNKNQKKYFEILHSKAEVLHFLKNHTEAVKICTEILNFDRKNISVLRLRGNAKIGTSNNVCNNSAIADFTEAIDLEKGSESFDKSVQLKINESLAQSYSYRAVAYMDCENLGAALSDLDNAINLNSSNGGAYYNRGLVHKWQGNNTKACENFKKAQQYGVNTIKQLNELKCL